MSSRFLCPREPVTVSADCRGRFSFVKTRRQPAWQLPNERSPGRADGQPGSCHFGFRPSNAGAPRVATPRFGVPASVGCATAVLGALKLFNAIGLSCASPPKGETTSPEPAVQRRSESLFLPTLTQPVIGMRIACCQTTPLDILHRSAITFLLCNNFVMYQIGYEHHNRTACQPQGLF